MEIQASVLAWVSDLADALLRAKRCEDVIGLLRGRLGATGWLEHRLDLAKVLCTTGRGQDALALLDEATPAEPVQADHIAVARAELMLALGQVVEAEQILRDLLGRRWLSGQVRGPALGVLNRLLVATGREAEAARLQAPEADLLDQRPLPNPPARREGPKIGRNEPCPCGSGKKYKKCCGR